MRLRNFTFLILALTAFFYSQPLIAADGKIGGRITDENTGEPLLAANVILEGTSMGAATNMDGEFLIPVVPVGNYTLKASYIGYESKSFQISIKENDHIMQNIELKAVYVSTEELVVTGQASGQNAAINQQVSSDKIVNVVSSAKIQALPDANAAESIGRLPGVALLRNGGQATQVVIRGLQPQYSMITINGVQIPANDAGNITTSGDYATPTNNPGSRAVDLSMVSSNSLEGIEVYKTLTPDMDASVLGGTVNFGLREAKGSNTSVPVLSFLAQGSYNDLVSTYNDFKFVASAEQRYFKNKFGVFVQGIIQKQNLTSNELGSTYYQPNDQDKPDSVVLGSLNLTFSPVEQKRYDGVLTLDYKIPDGKITLLNLISHGTSTTETHSQTYNLGNNATNTKPKIQFGTQLSSNELNVVSNILEYHQTFGSFNTTVKLSNAYSDNRTPNGWRVDFTQTSVGLNKIPNNRNPIQIAATAEDSIKFDNMIWDGNSTWNSFSKQNDVQVSLDLENTFNISNLMSVKLKAGGQYKYTTRYYNFDDGFGSLLSGAAQGFRYDLVQALPWLTQDPYNFDPAGRPFHINGFYDKNMDFGKFLKGDYNIHSAVDIDKIDRIMKQIKLQGAAITQYQSVPSYVPDVYTSTASDYTGSEFRSAEYFMATINIGPQVTIIAGARYQGLKTSYTAAQFNGNADAPNPYPGQLTHTIVTKDQYHGYLLPNINLKYSPVQWLSFRGSYTASLAYPDFNTIIPRIDIAGNSGHWVVWNNSGLKPAESHNYDVQMQVYSNDVGLFSVSPFLKRIDNLIFSQSTYITDPSKYEGLPSTTKAFDLTTFLNNPNRVDVWGIETEWQTHFWYLPGVLSGLVFNINYTHIFSEAIYPYTDTRHSPVYPFPTYHVDTTYTDRLLQQPNDIVNLSIGFDYSQFSVLVSMIYQADIYSNSSAFYNSLRADKSKYLRWDLSMKQGLPWYGMEVFFNINNLNSEEDVYLNRGSGFPNSASNYGMTADLGIRFKIE